MSIRKLKNTTLSRKTDNSEKEVMGFPISSSALVDLLEDVLGREVPFRFKARGGSMTPFIRDGDVITIAPLSQQIAGLGSIVAFKRPETGSLVVHRIVAVSENAVLIHGDNNPQNSDGWIPCEYLLGRVIEIKRDGRHVWLGLGLERYLIAFLSRKKWLTPVRSIVATVRGRK